MKKRLWILLPVLLVVLLSAGLFASAMSMHEPPPARTMPAYTTPANSSENAAPAEQTPIQDSNAFQSQEQKKHLLKI
ncbi:MAG TPA: hypothetical protein GX701_04995 [Clostridiales bacterium]|jgi:flagellar basal body-associated protein FliL|nr:hypothetical protein [Clostridiales bacterium]